MVRKAIAVLLVVCFVLATVGAASAHRTTTVSRANLAIQNTDLDTNVETFSIGGTNVALGNDLPSAGNTVTTSVSSSNSIAQLNT